MKQADYQPAFVVFIMDVYITFYRVIFTCLAKRQ